MRSGHDAAALFLIAAVFSIVVSIPIGWILIHLGVPFIAVWIITMGIGMLIGMSIGIH